MPTKTLPAAPKRVYQLLIELDEVAPRVWRRLWVPDTLTMAKLDRVIQTAMGWTNSHLHEFEVDGKRYAMPDDEGIDDRPTLDERRSPNIRRTARSSKAIRPEAAPTNADACVA